MRSAAPSATRFVSTRWRLGGGAWPRGQGARHFSSHCLSCLVCEALGLAAACAKLIDRVRHSGCKGQVRPGAMMQHGAGRVSCHRFPRPVFAVRPYQYSIVRRPAAPSCRYYIVGCGEDIGGVKAARYIEGAVKDIPAPFSQPARRMFRPDTAVGNVTEHDSSQAPQTWESRIFSLSPNAS